MPTRFPTAFDNFTNPTGVTDLDTSAFWTHAQQHSDLNDAVEAIQLRLGIDGVIGDPEKARHVAEHLAMGMPFRFPNFKRSLLPALVVGATASRSGGVVTVSATAHGITTGATYTGFRIFYPGSPSLLAGWYESILSVPDANTLTFSAPGANFGSESINGGAAYTATTDFYLTTVPGGMLNPFSSIRYSALWGGDATAATKSQRIRIGSTSTVVKQTTTAPHCEVTCTVRIGETLQTQYMASAENAAVVSLSSYSFDFSGDVQIGFAGTLPSAGTFLTLFGASMQVEI